jgi:hypothetical protein
LTDKVPRRTKEAAPLLLSAPPPAAAAAADSALAGKSAFRAAPEELAKPSKVAAMPKEFWAALKFFLAETELPPQEAAAVEASFREVIATSALIQARSNRLAPSASCVLLLFWFLLLTPPRHCTLPYASPPCARFRPSPPRCTVHVWRGCRWTASKMC